MSTQRTPDPAEQDAEAYAEGGEPAWVYERRMAERAAAEQAELEAQRHAELVEATRQGAAASNSDWLTLDDAAALVHAPRETIRNWVWQGRLKGYKPGKALLIKRAELLAFVDSSETVAQRARKR